MSYRRGSFHTAKPGRGSFNSSPIKELHEGFAGLLKTVTSAADTSAHTVLASQTTYRMSFDEVEHVPVTSPELGTIMLTGLDDPVSAEAALEQLGKQKLVEMQATLTQQLKEKGYG